MFCCTEQWALTEVVPAAAWSKSKQNIDLYSALLWGNPSPKCSDVAHVSEGITEFYLLPTHEPHLRTLLSLVTEPARWRGTAELTDWQDIDCLVSGTERQSCWILFLILECSWTFYTECAFPDHQLILLAQHCQNKHKMDHCGKGAAATDASS